MVYVDQLYLKDEERKQKALKWDQEEEARMIEYRKNNKNRDITGDDEQLLLDTLKGNEQADTIEEFVPVPWKVVAKTKQELKRYNPPEEVTTYLRDVESGVVEEHKNYQEVIKKMGKDYDKIADTNMRIEVSAIRHNYVTMQHYGYLFDDHDTDKPLPASELTREPPVYVDSYVEKNRERIMQKKEKLENEVSQVKADLEKYQRFKNFKEEFKDIFEEHDELVRPDKRVE